MQKQERGLTYEKGFEGAIMKKITVAWLSAGVSSFVAAYLIRDEIDEFYYIDIDDQHPDSMRFIKDCETALKRPIKILKSNYGSVENAILAQGCIRMVKTGFAPCTAFLKTSGTQRTIRVVTPKRRNNVCVGI